MKNKRPNNNVDHTISLSYDKNKENEEDLKEDFQIENQTNFNFKNNNKSIGENEKNDKDENAGYQNYQKIKKMLDNQKINSPINVYNGFQLKKNNNNIHKKKNKQSFDYDDENENERGINNDEDNSNSSNNIYKIKKNNFIIDDNNNLFIDSGKYSNKDKDKDKENNRINNDIDNNNSGNNNNIINKDVLDGSKKEDKKNKYLNLYKKNENEKDSDIKDKTNDDNDKCLNDLKSFENDNTLNNRNNDDNKIDSNDFKKDIDNSHNKDSNDLNLDIHDLLKLVDTKSKTKNNQPSYNSAIKQKYKMIKPNLYLYNYQDIVNKDKKPKYRNYSESKSQNNLKANYKKKLENKMKMLGLNETPNTKSYKKLDNNTIDDDTLMAFAKLNKSEDNIKLSGDPENADINMLIGRDKEKLMRYDPIRRNIEMIKSIENFKKQGIVFPGIRKERKILVAPLKYCYKFRADPQKFYSETLCDSMYEALDFKIIKDK